MIKVCDGEKVYYLLSKTEYRKSDAVLKAFEMCGNTFSLTSAQSIEYGQFLVCKSDGDYWCITMEE